MPDIYLPNTRVPELNGIADGGVTVVLHRPEDIELLYALASLAPRPPASPIKSLAAALSDERLDLAAWHREWVIAGNTMPAADKPLPSPTSQSNEDSGSEEDYLSDLTALRDILVVLEQLWSSEPADVPLMSCVVTLESERAAGSSGVRWETTTANLAFGRGSVDVWLGRGARRAGRFLAGLVLGGGIDAAARAPNLVDRARQRAIARLGDTAAPPSAAPVFLPDLRHMSPPDVAGKTLVVLIHGLCSTDVGTFGDFETHLRTLPNVFVAGFPHDSLTTPIRSNAKEFLGEVVLDAVDFYPDVAFRKAERVRHFLVAESVEQ
jgi:hypothetical protein